MITSEQLARALKAAGIPADRTAVQIKRKFPETSAQEMANVLLAVYTEPPLLAPDIKKALVACRYSTTEIDAVISRLFKPLCVHRRAIFGFAGQQAITVSRNGGWVPAGNVYGPFGYAVPPVQPGAKRKWRLYAVYCDENSGGDVHVQVKFELSGGTTPVFTLPRIAGGLEWNADGYSDWFQFGNGTEQEINKGHASCFVRLNSTAPYDNHGLVYWMEIHAYDFF